MPFSSMSKKDLDRLSSLAFRLAGEDEMSEDPELREACYKVASEAARVFKLRDGESKSEKS